MKRKNLYLKWKDKTEVIERLKNGAVGIVPTETVYGLIALPAQTKRVNAIKNSPENKPLTFFISALNQIDELWPNCPEAFSKTVLHWPGPFTLLAGTPLVGIRMPAVETLLHIITQTGPLASTSANLSSQPTCSNIENMPPELIENVDFIIDEKITSSSNVASTILKWENNEVSLIREGSLSLSELEVQST